MKLKKSSNICNTSLCFWSLLSSVTSKKWLNVYKSGPKRFSLVKWKILTPLPKLPKMCWQFGQKIMPWALKTCPSIINRLIWSHCSWGQPCYDRKFLFWPGKSLKKVSQKFILRRVWNNRGTRTSTSPFRKIAISMLNTLVNTFLNGPFPASFS